ncbi:oxygen-insensitive NADPH nitroreductase [Bacillaceae bacterium S4-13-58]
MKEENSTRELMKTHRSIRKFTDQDIPEEMIRELVECARWAPTSHNVQAYSVISVRNKDTKKKLEELCGNQRYVSQCPVFFVFVLDFYRHWVISEAHQSDFEMDEVENLIIGAVDTALFAENFYLAANSFGLGGVMIGGIRNRAKEVASLLNLPKWTLPIMGMCLGYPDQDPWQKPRIGTAAIYHEESYQTDQLEEILKEYEERSSDYYTRRTSGQRTDGWGKQMVHYLSKKRRVDLTQFIKEQGFSLK